MALKGLGETEKARAALTTALSLDPLNQQVLLLKKDLETN
jgi:Flp pilus assembly protein TadD